MRGYGFLATSKHTKVSCGTQMGSARQVLYLMMLTFFHKHTCAIFFNIEKILVGENEQKETSLHKRQTYVS